MNLYYNDLKEKQECRCPCHCHCHYHLNCQTINQEINTNSQTISDINNPIQNYSQYISSPLYNSRDSLNYTYTPNIDDKSYIRNMLLRGRAKSVNDKINSIDFSKNNNNSKKRMNEPFDNNLRNINTFQVCKSPIIQSMSNLKYKINKLNNENEYLTQLLSKIPRHERSRYGPRHYLNKSQLSFTNSNSKKIPKEIQPCFTFKQNKPTSIIMPPNYLDSVIMKNNIYI